MVLGEVGSRRPDCILGSAAGYAHIRPAPWDPPPTRTFGFPFPHRSLWDFPRGAPRTVKTPLVSPRRVGAKWTLFFFPK